MHVDKIVYRQKTDDEKIVDILGYFWSLSEKDQTRILEILTKPKDETPPEEDWDMLPDVEDLEKIVNRELEQLKLWEEEND